MLNYIYKLFKSLWNWFFGSKVKSTTKNTIVPRSSSDEKVTKIAPKQHDFYLVLANKLEEPTGVNKVFSRGVWDGTDVSIGLKEIKSRLLEEKGRMVFLENNILSHKQQKGIDWYLAPNRLGRFFNLSSGGAHQQVPLTSAEKEHISNDDVCKQNFAVIFEIFLKLHHDPARYYGTRVEKFFSAAYDFYRLDQDPSYKDLVNLATHFFKKYAKNRESIYSKYLGCTISEFSYRLSQKEVSEKPYKL